MKLLSLIVKILLAITMLLPGGFAAGQVAVTSGGAGSISGTGGANNQGSAATGLGCAGGGVCSASKNAMVGSIVFIS